MITRPALKYNGGKWLLGPWIRSFLPEHETFVEGFGGGGSITIQKERSIREFYFDIDSEVANFMWVMSHRNSAKELIRRIYWTPYAREIHAWAVSDNVSSDPIDRALKFYCKCWMDRNYVRGKSFRLYGNMDSSGGHLPASLWANVRHLYKIMVTKGTRDNKRRERTEALWLNPLVQRRLAEKELGLFEAGV
ncbi:DNA adenine methylase [Leptospira santarosai]|uniref:DNA adenine methylase n=1 Tax=Leptospira santarosai TaxID=28183 RepID=UPI0024AEA4FD|nr:DNA adenine methylase [Leptospira santarosai]MDI7165950.1 DNA adenine methylase [Leptospira santarosai]